MEPLEPTECIYIRTTSINYYILSSYIDINNKKLTPPKELKKALVDITDDDTKKFIQFASKSIIDIAGCRIQNRPWEVMRRAQLTQGCPLYSADEIQQQIKN